MGKNNNILQNNAKISQIFTKIMYNNNMNNKTSNLNNYTKQKNTRVINNNNNSKSYITKISILKSTIMRTTIFFLKEKTNLKNKKIIWLTQ